MNVKKFKEIKLALSKGSTVWNAEIKESMIEYIKNELCLKLKNELNFVVNEVVEDMYYKVEVGIDFLYVDIPENEEELFDLIKLLIEKYSSLKSKFSYTKLEGRA